MKIIKQELTLVLLTCILALAPTVSFARVATSASDDEILNRKCDELFIWNKNKFENEQNMARQNNNGIVELDLLQFQFMEQRANLHYFGNICPSHPNASSRIRNASESLQAIQSMCVQKGFDETCDLVVKNKPQEYIDNTILAIIKEGKKNSQNQSNNNPKKLTAAEQKRQNQQQKFEEKMSQSQQLAESTQSKADAARQGKRRQHDPSAEATNCIQPMEGKKEDRIKNICNFEIYYTFCYYRPEESSFATFTTCEKQSFGAVQLKPGKSHVVYKRAEKFYWHACKLPTWSLDSEYIDGKGIRGRCYDVGGSN